MTFRGISIVLCVGCLAGCRGVDVRRTEDAALVAAESAQPMIGRETAAARPDGVVPARWQEEVAAPPVRFAPEPVELGMPLPDSMPPMSLADFEGIAWTNHPVPARAAANVEAARGAWLQAGLWPNPVVGYHATEIGNQGTAGQQGAFVSQKFITAGKLRLDRRTAEADIRRTEAQFSAERQRLLADVQSRFYDALIAQSRLELAAELARLGDGLAEATARLEEAGQASENDRLRAEIESESSHLAFDVAHDTYVEAWRRLAATAGAPGLPPHPLAGDAEAEIPDFTWEEAQAVVYSGHPELAAAAARLSRARANLERQSRQWIPDVDVFVSLRHHNVTSDNVANVQVGVPVPIYDANQGRVRQAQAEIAAAQNDLRRLELFLQDRLASAYRQYENSLRQARRYSQAIVPRARRSFDLLRQGYKEGQSTYLELLIAQRTYIQTSLRHLDALAELRRALALIESQLLSGSLSDRP